MEELIKKIVSMAVQDLRQHNQGAIIEVIKKSIHHQTEQILEKQTRNECLKRIFITVFISVVKNERSSLRNLLLIFQTN